MIDSSQKLALRNILVPLVAAVIERLVDSIPTNIETPAPVAANTNTSTAAPVAPKPRKARIGKPPLSAYKIRRIREARGKRGMTIKQAAAFARVSTSSVARYSKAA